MCHTLRSLHIRTLAVRTTLSQPPHEYWRPQAILLSPTLLSRPIVRGQELSWDGARYWPRWDKPTFACIMEALSFQKTATTGSVVCYTRPSPVHCPLTPALQWRRYEWASSASPQVVGLPELTSLICKVLSPNSPLSLFATHLSRAHVRQFRHWDCLAMSDP